MKTVALLLALPLIALSPSAASAQDAPFQRLPAEVLDVVPPSERVEGVPGGMTLRSRECRTLPASGVRRRIVDIAVQEWAFFGFPVLDRMENTRLLRSATGSGRPAFEPSRGRAPLPSPGEAARVAASIAGYWAVTPEGAGIVADQNRAWNGSGGVGARWRSPWSAAFVSWVMCEAGLGTRDRFRHAIAHHAYIDQAIRARDGQAPEAAFVAYDMGEAEVEPGDLLCSARRPAYRNLAERRRQMGGGARSHCDIVVVVDEAGERVLAIGGNVLRAVSLKVLPAVREPDGGIRPLAAQGRPLFAHLKLRADPVEANALLHSATLGALACSNGPAPPPRTAFVLSALEVGVPAGGGC